MATTSEVLLRAAELLETVGWTKKAYARDTSGHEVPVLSQRAACFCVFGAIRRVAPGDIGACLALKNFAQSEGIWQADRWQDEPERTRSEVTGLLRRAARAAQEAETCP